MSLTTDALHELLEYKDGELYWKVTRSRLAHAGDRAGHLDKSTGYRVIRINGKKYAEHRVIYMLHHGHIPNRLVIDHIDRDPTNNRIENLRPVTVTENNWNTGKPSIRQLPSGSWNSRIQVNGYRKMLGTFKTEEEAVAAYYKAKQELHIIEER